VTHDEIMERVRADYRAHLGKLLRTRYYMREDSVTRLCEPPALVRVIETSDEDLEHTCDGDEGVWHDPYWNVELVEQHPSVDGVRSLWVYGTSYREHDGKVETSCWELAEEVRS